MDATSDDLAFLSIFTEYTSLYDLPAPREENVKSDEAVCDEESANADQADAHASETCPGAAHTDDVDASELDLDEF